MTVTDHALLATAMRMVICGNIIERRDVDEVLDIIKSWLHGSHARGLAVGSVNLDHLHHFRKAGAAPTGQGAEWLLLADGMPIAWRGQLLTAEPWPRVTGADLLPRVLELAQGSGCRVGFLGGTPETHRLLAARLARQYPDLTVAGMWSPTPHQIEKISPYIAEAIESAGTDILVVSLGKPRQEQWVDRYGPSTGARLFLPFGCAIDVLAGTKRRAPGWMQRFGLEWFYRLTREPRRLARRYVIQGPIALMHAVRAKLILSPGAYYAGTPAAEPYDKPLGLPRQSAVAIPAQIHGPPL